MGGQENEVAANRKVEVKIDGLTHLLSRDAALRLSRQLVDSAGESLDQDLTLVVAGVAQRDLIEAVMKLVEYWATRPVEVTSNTDRVRLEGLVVSVLELIDGMGPMDNESIRDAIDGPVPLHELFDEALSDAG